MGVKFRGGQMKRDLVTGEDVHPDDVVLRGLPCQKHARVPDVHVMVGGRVVFKKPFGRLDDRGVHLDHVQFQFRPMPFQPFGDRPSALSQDQPPLRLGRQRQGGHHHLTVRQRQSHRVGLPHDRVEGVVEHQEPQAFLVADPHLLVGAVLLMDRRRIDENRVEAQPDQRAQYPDDRHQRRPLDPAAPPQPAQAQDHQHDAQDRDQGQAPQPRQKEKRRTPGPDQAADGGDGDHRPGVPAQMSHIGDRQTQEHGEHAA